MTGFEVYQTYLSLKLHFTSDNYNYFQFNGKIRATEKTFEERQDRYFFKKMAAYYSDTEIIGFFVSHLLDNPSFWIGSFKTIHSKVYTDWKKKLESMFTIFCKDIDHLTQIEPNIDNWFNLKGHTHPLIVRQYLAEEISLETVVIIDSLLHFVVNVDRHISEGFVWPDLKKKIRNYRPFLAFEADKYIRALQERLANVLDSE
jgi:hypothetical protein